MAFQNPSPGRISFSTISAVYFLYVGQQAFKESLVVEPGAFLPLEDFMSPSSGDVPSAQRSASAHRLQTFVFMSVSTQVMSKCVYVCV